MLRVAHSSTSNHSDREDWLQEIAIATPSRIDFRATVFELYAVAIIGLLGVITIIDAIRNASPWFSDPPPLIMLGIAAFVNSGRKLRMQQLDLPGSLSFAKARRSDKLVVHGTIRNQ